MKKNGSFPALVFLVILGLGVALAYALYGASGTLMPSLWVVGGALVLASVASTAIQVADQWSKAVVLRLGKFRSLAGPGLFLIVPVIDAIPYWIDTRVLTSSFKAEKTLTRDTVPVDVDAVLFWKIVDPKKAALDVADYQSAINWAAQTALRDVIGKTMLSDMLEGRDKISAVLQSIIDVRTEPWGINVISVEVKDVLIPPALEDAMSMQAQAERERQARVILGDSERQVAETFGEAAKTYAHDPIALHLRAMNMLYEGLKENSTIVIVPSSAVDTIRGGRAFCRVAKQARKGREIPQGGPTPGSEEARPQRGAAPAWGFRGPMSARAQAGRAAQPRWGPRQSTQLGGLAGMTALSLGLGPERAAKGNDGNPAEHSGAGPGPAPPAATRHASVNGSPQRGSEDSTMPQSAHNRFAELHQLAAHAHAAAAVAHGKGRSPHRARTDPSGPGALHERLPV